MAPAKTYEVRVVLVDGDWETVTLARVIAPDDDSVDAAALAAVDAAITDADMRIALNIPDAGESAVSVEVAEIGGGEPVRWLVLADRYGFAARQPPRRQQPRPSAAAWKAWRETVNRRHRRRES